MQKHLGLLFPGQGSQFVGMGKSLYEEDPRIPLIYEEASDIVGYDMASLCFYGPIETLSLTEYTQPALLVTSLVAFRLFEASSLRASAVAGHSLGEYSALVAAGGLPLPDAIRLVQQRGQYMAHAVPPGSGLVVAVLGLSSEKVQKACREAQNWGVVAPVNYNCPGQIVMAGEKTAVERAIDLVKQQGARRAIPLPVSVPVHTSLMQIAADQLKKDIESSPWSDLTVPLINNADAKPLLLAQEVKASLIRQLPSPVRWEQTIRTMAAMGISTFLEVGPGKVLTGLVKRIVPEAMALPVHDSASFEAAQAAVS